MSNLFIRNASFIVTCDDEDHIYRNCDMLVENEHILYIGPDGQKYADEHRYVAERIIDATGMTVYPGLINTHHHLYQIATRNLPATQNMELFDWLTYLYEIWKNIDADTIRRTSGAGLRELVRTGCTTCFDHHYVFPAHTVAPGAEGLIDTQAEVAREVGIRMYMSRGSMSLSKKDGGLPPDTVVQETDAIIRDSERLICKYNDKSRYSMLRVALAPCSPFSVTEDLLTESAALARQYGVRLHTHLAETLDEERYMLDRYGMRPLAYMEKVGWIGDDVWYAHGIHFNDEELKLLADTHTGVAHCPISNMKLSSGIARIPDMLRLGVRVGLAVDGSASNDGSNMLEELRVGYLLHRLNSSAAAPTGYEMLKIATRGSASILGRDDIGHLAPDMAADFFMIRNDRPELEGCLEDPGSMLATVGFKGYVDLTVINGRVVWEK